MPNKDSFVRWQSMTLTQLSTANGLLLGFAGATLAFALYLIREPGYSPGCWGIAFMLLCLLALLASIAVGMWCVINRLLDFRLTSEIAKYRQKREQAATPASSQEDSLEYLRTVSSKLGKRTWVLFWWQLALFCAGVTSLIVVHAIVYRSRIF